MSSGLIIFLGGIAIGFVGGLFIFLIASMSDGTTRHNRP